MSQIVNAGKQSVPVSGRQKGSATDPHAAEVSFLPYITVGPTRTFNASSQRVALSAPTGAYGIGVQSLDGDCLFLLGDNTVDASSGIPLRMGDTKEFRLRSTETNVAAIGVSGSTGTLRTWFLMDV